MNKGREEGGSGTFDNEGPEVAPFAGTYLPDCAAFVHSNQPANKFLLPYPFSRRWNCKKRFNVSSRLKGRSFIDYE